jgi:hypothetical protein
MLRYLTSIGMIKEIGPNEFTTNTVSNVFAEPINQAAIHHSSVLIPTATYHPQLNTLRLISLPAAPIYQALPDFLVSPSYRDITGNAHTALELAFNPDLAGFAWTPV